MAEASQVEPQENWISKSVEILGQQTHCLANLIAAQTPK